MFHWRSDLDELRDHFPVVLDEALALVAGLPKGQGRP